MTFMLLRKLNGDWVNLYPPRDGEEPISFKTRVEAEKHAARLLRTMAVRCRIVPRAEALKHLIPKRRW